MILFQFIIFSYRYLVFFLVSITLFYNLPIFCKGAIATGIEILLESYGAKVEDISEVFLAGAFGNYLKPESACKVGLIPKELKEKINGIGNAAGVGAKLAMLSEKEYERAIKLYQKIDYVELSIHPKFNKTFLTKVEF